MVVAIGILEVELQNITERIIQQHARVDPNERMIVGIAGRPGSGKTCLARVFANAILDRTSNSVHVVVMAMDGYHLYRDELSRMTNSEYAFARRGAHWTFNPEKLCMDLVRIRKGDDIKVPSFDHSLKDPKENDIAIPKNAKIVLVEGNYLFYTKNPMWNKINEIFHLKIFLECDPMECTERLALRHMATIGLSREEALLRANGSDFKNGDLIDTTKDNADVVCHSIKVRQTSASLTSKE